MLEAHPSEARCTPSGPKPHNGEALSSNIRCEQSRPELSTYLPITAMAGKGRGHLASPGKAQFQQEAARYSHIPEEGYVQKHVFMIFHLVNKYSESYA